MSDECAMHEMLLGLMVSDVLERLAAQGIIPQVILTAPPRGANPDGVRRVVRVGADCRTIWVCAFDPHKTVE